MVIIDIVKVFLPSTLSFIIGIIIAPALIRFLYKYEMWKKKSGKMTLDGKETPIFNSLHKHKEVGTPKMGGIVIWSSAFIATVLFWVLAHIFPSGTTAKIDFLSRNQTWIPLFTLVVGSLVGLIDDYLEVKGNGGHIAGGLSLKKRVLVVAVVALFCALWFYFKLGVTTLGVPHLFGWQDIQLGWLFIPFFIAVVVFIYSGGVIDGLDGLAGGIFAIMFSAYAAIAFYQQQVNLAAFCTVVVGGILAFLWFNIPPARFYMSETGTMGLTVTLAVVAFMTDALGGGHGLLVLPVIALPLVITTLSDIIQVISKKLRNGKKVFKIAPLHHHFEALGWPAYKVTMRYWVTGIMVAIIGIILGLIGH